MEPDGAPPDSTGPDQLGTLSGGCGVVFLLHVAFVSVMGAAAMVPQLETAASSAIAALGLTQTLYVVPFAVVAFRRGRSARGKGLLLGALVTLLLNASCWGALTLGNLHHS